MVAVITGASGGLGRELAGQLAAKAERINQRRREKQKHENKLRRQGRSGKPYIPTRIKRRGETQSEKQS